MKGPTYFAAMAVLAAALIFAQSSTPSDQQRSNAATTGASGRSNAEASTSTRGTTSTTLEGTEQEPSTQPNANTPQSASSTDQQPNTSGSPNSGPPQACLNRTPAARAVATHTPDPGTCMNPAALQTGQDSNLPRPSPHCD